MNYVPYQLCPKCNGAVWNPAGSSILNRCRVCKGDGILPMHVTEEKVIHLPVSSLLIKESNWEKLRDYIENLLNTSPRETNVPVGSLGWMLEQMNEIENDDNKKSPFEGSYEIAKLRALIEKKIDKVKDKTTETQIEGPRKAGYIEALRWVLFKIKNK